MKPSLTELRAHVTAAQPQRAAHILGCEETAAELALRWGESVEKARYAALLHDVTKQYSHAEQLKLVEKYGIIIDAAFDRFPALAHAETGAATAQAEYGMEDDIVLAIRYHTTGRPGMTKLEKILYLADYIEPGRSFPGLDDTRALAFQDLDAAVLRSTADCLIYNLKKSRPVHPITVETYNELVEQANKTQSL